MSYEQFVIQDKIFRNDLDEQQGNKQREHARVDQAHDHTGRANGRDCLLLFHRRFACIIFAACTLTTLALAAPTLASASLAFV